MDKTPEQQWAELLELAKIHGKPYGTTTTCIVLPQWLFDQMSACSTEVKNG
jgi:hypothetical protein